MLTVILKRGFDDDRVVVRVNGREVFDREHVRQRRQIDRAASFDHEVDAGDVDVEIQVPTRGLAATRHVRVKDHTTVLASIEDGRLELTQRSGVVGDA